ncbi:MAG: nickel pincer cofactor biosynthesis protein LarB [Gemmatimonadota bacterium]|nr:nickel pincer cofactor biosynthesis protein LarB [Gemmatimonadota bacterium]
MTDTLLRTTLSAVRDGELDVEEAFRRLAGWPHERLPFATIDHHRSVRNGFPEVVYCAGKTPDQAAAVAKRIWERSRRLLATRADEAHARGIARVVPEARHNALARTVSAGAPEPGKGPPVLVMTAGTSDLPVAEEAIETLRVFGRRVERVVDVGVAGVHRVLAHEEALGRAAAVVVVAGMDGALPSVVGGLVEAPVIAVPTSVGYGAAFDGLAALLTMLNSCAAGVVTVNIDNGFGAGAAAARFARGVVSPPGVDLGEAKSERA